MRKIKPAVLLCVSLMLCACNFENFDKRCAREAKEYTEKQCPRRMDPYTVMDSLTYQEHTHTLAYHYTLEGKLDNDSILTRELFDAFAQQLRKELINSVDLKMYKEKSELPLLLLFKIFGQITI